MTVSSSVTAGLQIQLKAGALNAALYSSPRIAGNEELDGKKAMKFGDCLFAWKNIYISEMSS